MCRVVCRVSVIATFAYSHTILSNTFFHLFSRNFVLLKSAIFTSFMFASWLCAWTICKKFNFFGGPYLLINFSECSKRDEQLARNSVRERENNKSSLPNLFHKRAEHQRAIIVVEIQKKVIHRNIRITLLLVIECVRNAAHKNPTPHSQ